ncbi:MAG: hypothetical protein V7727_08275, partial [Sneathiella sp.]
MRLVIFLALFSTTFSTTVMAFDTKDMARFEETGSCQACDLRQVKIQYQVMKGANFENAILRDTLMKETN